MAGPPFNAATVAAAAALPSNNSSSSFIFDVYDDTHGAAAVVGSRTVGSPADMPPPPALPNGRCNFVDLTHGSSGPQCGCRRFWSRTNLASTPVAASFGASHGSGTSDLSQAGWCMCSHHACFHDQGPPVSSSATTQPTGTSLHAASSNSLFGLPPPPPPLSAPPLGQENERPRTNRAPLSPVQDPMAFQVFADPDGTQDVKGNPTDMLSLGLLPLNSSTRIGSSFGNIFSDPPAFGQVDGPAASSADHATPAPTSVAPSAAPSATASVVGHPTYDGSIPDTLSCGGGGGGGACLLPSQAPPRPSSITSSVSQTRYLRPFAGKGLQTLTHTSAPSPLKALMPPDSHETNESSAIAEATQPATQPGLSSIANAVQAHEQRLDKLENASFSVMPGQEEWSERHDHMDMRVTELESRVDEVEKRISNDDTASVIGGTGGSIIMSRRRLLGHDDDATTVSTDTSMAHPSELRSQIQALQAQVELLQAAALPTYNKPWELEVVFLPFPLKGVWVEASQFPTVAAAAAQRRQSGSHRRYSVLSHMGPKEDDEWTQMPNTLSRQTPDPQSPFVGGTADWSGDWADGAGSADAPRLLPRACAPGRVMDNRLRSCGLVQTLAVRGADARSLQLAMAAAFGTIWENMAQMSSTNRAHGAHRARGGPEGLQYQFLGLQNPWVPLRKIHKDSRLRFLTRAEMVTPNLWDATFLMSSVVMKATGRQRLYVTHPDAYLQDRHAYRAGWSWQRLRELNHAVSVSDDTCWAWDSRLDEYPSASLTSSVSTRHRPSPSPFSRETTPTAASHARHRSYGSPQPTALPAVATPAMAPAANPNTSHISARSHRSSGSAQQFYTAAQSPLMAPWTSVAGTISRRSPSPFLSASPGHRSAQQQQQQPQTSAPQSGTSFRKSRRPTPIRTTSMPAPSQPTGTARSAGLVATLSSPSASKRRMTSAYGHHVATGSSASTPSTTVYQRQRQQTGNFSAVIGMTYERRPSPLASASASRPSPRTARQPSPAPNAPTIAGSSIGKRRRTRSPSGFWPRYTPRRSMSRSPSVQPAPVPVWEQAQAQAQAQPPQQQAAQQQFQAPANRGATPFCYATPHSNAPTAEPASARQRGSRAGSARPMDYDLDMLGDGMDGYDDDFPMTQDVDSASEDHDGNRYDVDVDVYEDEDEEDVLDHTDRGLPEDSGRTGYGQAAARPLLPEDEPWPGIEDDNQEDLDAHMSDSENMEPSGESGQTGESGYSMPQTEDGSQKSAPQSPPRSPPASEPSSSQPSEYPSTHPAWPVGAAALAVLAQDEESRHRGMGMSMGLGASRRQQRREADQRDSGIGFVIHEDMDDGRMGVDG